MNKINRKKRSIFLLCLSLCCLILVVIAGVCNREAALVSDFSQASVSPSLAHLFGTDWLGRDMLSRTLRGLSISILIGAGAAVVSALISLILGIAAATLGKTADTIIGYFIDLVMGIPHILLLVLISIAMGRGLPGVVVGIVLTHWPSLARVIRGEILQLKEMPYILTARKLGKSRWQIAVKHMIPNVLPQFLTGMVLMFPHAVLHESSITFLGFGLSAEQPAIGIILSESMKYLIMGQWWLAVFPGAMLALVVLLFQYMGETLRRFSDPAGAHR